MTTPEEEPVAPEGMTRFLVNVGTGAGVGAIVGSIQSAWLAPHKMTDGVEIAVDALPSFRQMWKYVGGNAAIGAGIAATYTLSESFMASVRGEFDIYSTISGSFGAGVFVGSRTLSMTRAFVYGVGFALAGIFAHVSQGHYLQDKSRQLRFHEYALNPKNPDEKVSLLSK